MDSQNSWHHAMPTGKATSERPALGGLVAGQSGALDCAVPIATGKRLAVMEWRFPVTVFESRLAGLLASAKGIEADTSNRPRQPKH